MNEEPKKKRTWTEEIEVTGNELVDRVKEWIEDSSATKLIIRKPNGDVLIHTLHHAIEIPTLTLRVRPTPGISCQARKHAGTHTMTARPQNRPTTMPRSISNRASSASSPCSATSGTACPRFATQVA